ncbi:hypothetical protein KAR91_26450 [Candidatus Pacearchaeota archaeon]|nr:hypothetical protein [Candidatus Pacearchaeota archaeon]
MKWKISGDDRVRGKNGKPFDPRIIKFSRPEKKKVKINISLPDTTPTGSTLKVSIKLPVNEDYINDGRCFLLPPITIQ